MFLNNKKLATPDSQGADFVELFFDLVFVYAITRITGLTAHHFDVKHVLQSVLVFWLIWWGWTQFTWALNAANTKLAEVRLTVLIGTGIAFVLASSVDEAFTNNVIWFVIPYIILRTIGLLLYIRVADKDSGQRSAVLVFGVLSLLGFLAVLGGAFVAPQYRIWFWFVAIILDFIAGYFGGKSDSWALQANHFAERHGLIVIIALGELLIVSATSVSNLEVTDNLLIIGALVVLGIGLLWWSYFAWVHEFLEEHLSNKKGSKQARFARDTYSFIHFPLVCGIIGMAIGLEKIFEHPTEMVSKSVAFGLGGGYLLFIGSSVVAVWRAAHMILWPRLLILVISFAAVFLTVGFSNLYLLSMFVVSLLLINVIEWKKCDRQH